jgi:protein LTV1
LVDDAEDEKSVATTIGGTRRPKKNLDDDMATELQTDFRSRAERLRDSWDVQTILSKYFLTWMTWMTWMNEYSVLVAFDLFDERENLQRIFDSMLIFLGTYSNLDNHPGMIKEQNRRRIHIDPKTGMPVVTEKLSKKALVKQQEMMEAAKKSQQEAGEGDDSDDDFEDEFEGSDEEPENMGAKRNKAETKEEKKARKEAIKQEKKSRRETKKATKNAFANERSRQEKVMKNLKKGHGVSHID